MIEKIKQYKTKHQHFMTRLKHLRGKHDQLDHAWNRGMGQGGGGVGLASNQMGPLPTADFYRKRRIELMDKQRQGLITRAEMRQEMRQLRGITLGALESNQDNELVLANRRRSPKPSPGQLAFDFNDSTSVPQSLIQDLTRLFSFHQMNDILETQQFLQGFKNLKLDGVSYYSYIKNAQDAIKAGVAPGTLQLKKYAQPGIVLTPDSLYEGKLSEVFSILIQIDNVRGYGKIPATPQPDPVSEQILNAFLSTIGPDYDMLDQKFGISTWNLGSEDTTVQEEQAKTLRSEVLKSKQKILSLLLSTEKEQENYAILVDIANETSVRHLQMVMEMSDPYNTTARKKLFQDAANQLYDQLCVIEQELNAIEQKIKIPVSLIMAEYEKLNTLVHGGQIISPENLALLKSHGGKSINPTMQSGSYQPKIIPDQNVSDPQKAINNFTPIIDEVNKFLEVMVDERLLSDVNPDIMLSETESSWDSRYSQDYRLVFTSSSVPPVILAHELIHGMTQTDVAAPALRVNPTVLAGQGIMPPMIYVKDRWIKLRLNQLVSGFVRRRMQKTPGVIDAPGIGEYVLDNFLDFYMGTIRESETKTGLSYPPTYVQLLQSLCRDNPFPEVLTMGVTLMLTDPAGFARKDPEYYRFMCVILSGAWI